MATVARLKLGPKDQGRRVSNSDYREAVFAPGFQYELIDGKLEVAALPRWSHGKLDKWLCGELDRYSQDHPDIINMVYNKVRVFIPGRAATTCPEPDIAAYHDFPVEQPSEEVDWEVVSPVLVVEILSAGNVEKDVVRNVKLYLQAPAIREYWIVDGLKDSNRPTLRVYRRHGQRWRTIDVAFGETYTTRMLPGFELEVDPGA